MPRLRAGLAAALLTIALLAGGAAIGGRQGVAQNSIDPQRPDRHFRIENPAGLSDADALAIYDRIRASMVAGYRLSSLPYAGSYIAWPRFNTVPYRSAQHGERYVNNYANDAAKAYGDYESSGSMPAGAVLVKDSFTVTQRGDVFSGPLFMMEKMAAGFDPPRRNWRYTMIMPDGSLFGTSKGQGAERIGFCAACHELTGAGRDGLFYVPEDYRVRFSE